MDTPTPVITYTQLESGMWRCDVSPTQDLEPWIGYAENKFLALQDALWHADYTCESGAALELADQDEPTDTDNDLIAAGAS